VRGIPDVNFHKNPSNGSQHDT